MFKVLLMVIAVLLAYVFFGWFIEIGFKDWIRRK